MFLVWEAVLLGNWSFFFLRDVQLIRGGGGAQIFKINVLAAEHLIINIMAWVPKKINNPVSIVARKRLEINILTLHKLPVPPLPRRIKWSSS